VQFKNALIAFIASWFMILAPAGTAGADDRVAVFGDSWGVFSALALQKTFDNLAPGNDVLNAAFFGEKTTDMNTSSSTNGLPYITSTLDAHPTIDLVQLIIGGNDLTNNWTAGMSAVAEDVLLTSMTDNIEAVVMHIVDQDPSIEVFYSSYTYLRPLPSLGTPLEVNTVLQELQSRVEARLANIPQATTGNFYGLMQNLYGQSEFGLLPGDLSLPDINLPGPPEAFADAIHLRLSLLPEGNLSYNQLAEAQFAAFYQSRLMTIPEPSSLLLGAIATVGLVMRRKRVGM